MKMRKLLASGVAATMAVTSLATVASAAEQKFDMGTPDAGYNADLKLNADLNKAVGKSCDQAVMQKVVINVGDADEEMNAYGANGEYAILKVTGTKVEGEAVDRLTKEYKFKMVKDVNDRFTRLEMVVLKDTEAIYRDGEFAPGFFDNIESMTLEFPVKGSTTDKDTYNGWKNKKDGYKSFEIGEAYVVQWDGEKEVAGTKVTYGTERTVADDGQKVAASLDNLDTYKDNKAAHILAYAFAHGGWKASIADFCDPDVNKSAFINKAYPKLFVTDGVYGWFDDDNNGTYEEAYKNRDKTLVRNEIVLLSDSDSHEALNKDEKPDGADQSYNDDNYGTKPYEFAGLASQVADFFNKQTNGTITFKFTADNSSSSDDWFVGGVPSTQVGIKNLMDDMTANDFALFFNYDQTGSLQAITSIDKTAGTVTFDISEVLDALNGQTIGVIDNIYYGLTKGIAYDSWSVKESLKVEEITLAYDEDADADLDVEDDTADDDADEDDDVADDTADDDADEDDDASIDEDDDDADEDDDADADDADDDDKDVAGDVVTGGEDDDTNPATGVALAVVPALVAAAAAVVSKKRK